MGINYNRQKHWLYQDDILKIYDNEGNYAFFELFREEIIGQMTALAAETGHLIPHGVANLPAHREFKFLKPLEENRLYQIVPYCIYTRVEGAAGTAGLIFGGSAKDVGMGNISPLIEIQWELPSGSPRGDADKQSSVITNGIETLVGGRYSSGIAAPMISFRDDLNHSFDFFVIGGFTPTFRVNNNSGINIGDADPAPVNVTQFYIGFMGKKFQFRPVTEQWMIDKIKNDELEYKAVTIGGLSDD